MEIKPALMSHGHEKGSAGDQQPVYKLLTLVQAGTHCRWHEILKG